MVRVTGFKPELDRIGIHVLPHQHVFSEKKNDPLKDKLCALVPADSLEKWVAVILGEKVLPLLSQ